MKALDSATFNQNLEKRVKDVIEDYKLIKEGDTVAVALSGGKDSVLTLYMLKWYGRISDIDFDLQALAINEGIHNYRDKGMMIAQDHAEKLDIKLEIRSIQDEFNFTIDEAAGIYPTSCIPCGVFRRYLLNKSAHEMGADKLATGHNLDDEIQSFLMSFARSDVRRFGKFGPKLPRIHPRMVPRIKPLWLIPEKEVGIWAVMNNIKVHLAECPYAYTSMRARLKKYLNQAEEKDPGTKMNIMQSFQKTFQPLLDRTDHNQVEVQECDICGEPSSTEICKACEMKKKILNRDGN